MIVHLTARSGLIRQRRSSPVGKDESSSNAVAQSRCSARAASTTIAHLEAGTRQRLSREVADRLARALGVGLVDLLK